MEMSPSYNIQVTADQNFQSDEKEKVKERKKQHSVITQNYMLLHTVTIEQ